MASLAAHKSLLKAKKPDAGNGLDPLVTFFTIVTDSCAPIAHYCIQSYRRLAKVGLRFRQVVYGNCLSKETEERYYPQWRQLDYVDLMDNRESVGDKPPVPGETIVTPEGVERQLLGPFELGGTIWTRELKRFRTSNMATVDVSFAIPGFWKKCWGMGVSE